MSNDQQSLPLEDPNRLSLEDLLRIFKKLTIKTILSLAGVIATCTAILFGVGYYVGTKSSALEMRHPFDMRITIKEKDIERNEYGELNCKIKKLTLVEAPWESITQKGFKCLRIYRDFGDIENREIGEVQCLIKNRTMLDIIKEKIAIIFSIGISDTAFAQNFSLGVHQNDNNYTQVLVAPNTIHRKYGDGCILEYKVDSRGIADRNSYRWIVYKH